MPPSFTYRELKAIQEGHRRNAEVYLAIKSIPMNQFPLETDQVIAIFDALLS